MTPFDNLLLVDEALFPPSPIAQLTTTRSKIGLNNNIKNKFIYDGKLEIEDQIATFNFTPW